MRIRTCVLTIAMGLLLCLTAAKSASACPMCQLATDSDNRLPRAYMYSVLFMMGMPATISTGFGIGFWRLSRKAARLQREAALQAVLGAADPAVEATQLAEPRPSVPQRALPAPGLPGPGLVFP